MLANLRYFTAPLFIAAIAATALIAAGCDTGTGTGTGTFPDTTKPPVPGGPGSPGDPGSPDTSQPSPTTPDAVDPLPSHGTCQWVSLPLAASHQRGPDWCPAGSYLTQIDLDGVREVSAHDAPLVGQARCCSIAAAPPQWGTCSWREVGVVSHQQDGSWCDSGELLTQFDLDGDASYSVFDAPYVGGAKCCEVPTTASQPAAPVWVEVGPQESHGDLGRWCPDGTFLIALDLDGGDSGYAGHDAPWVGRALCAYPGS